MCKCVECLKYRNKTNTKTPYFQTDRGLTVMRFELLQSTACFMDCRSLLCSDMNRSDDVTSCNIY